MKSGELPALVGRTPCAPRVPRTRSASPRCRPLNWLRFVSDTCFGFLCLARKLGSFGIFRIGFDSGYEMTMAPRFARRTSSRPPHHHSDFRYTGLSFSTVNAVEFQSVSKSYAIYDSPGDRLKELLSLNRARCHKDFLALDDVTFEVKRGETFCIEGDVVK